MARENLLIGILIGILSYSCLYLGKGIQKLGINKIKAKGSIRKKESGIWIIGTILTALPLFIQWAALIFAPVNVIAPLEGLGLIVLALYSYFALKEKITRMEIAGISCIVAGTFLTAYFASSTGELTLSQFRPEYFVYILSGFVVIELILFLISRKAGYKLVGVVLGFSSGTMMAFQSISKRVSIIPGLFVWGMVLTFIFAILTLALSQIGFVRARANQVVSSFTSASILVASTASIFILSEHISTLQYAGIGVIIVGVFFITIFNPNANNDEGPEKKTNKQAVDNA